MYHTPVNRRIEFDVALDRMGMSPQLYVAVVTYTAGGGFNKKHQITTLTIV